MRLTGQGLAGFQRSVGLLLLFSLFFILLFSFKLVMIKDGQVERGGGGNKSMTLRPRVVGAAQFVFALNNTKSRPLRRSGREMRHNKK